MPKGRFSPDATRSVAIERSSGLCVRVETGLVAVKNEHFVRFHSATRVSVWLQKEGHSFGRGYENFCISAYFASTPWSVKVLKF